MKTPSLTARRSPERSFEKRRNRPWTRVTVEQRRLIQEWDIACRALGNQKSFSAKIGVKKATMQYIIRDIREAEALAYAAKLQ